MKADPDRFARSLSLAEDRLRGKKDALIEELMRRALAQNPDLAQALDEVDAQRERVKDMRQAEEIALYHDWLAKREAQRIANRKLRYDDRRNYNKLNAVRRDCVYKSASRLEQLEMEVRRYWEPMGLDMPEELAAELSSLRAERQSLAG